MSSPPKPLTEYAGTKPEAPPTTAEGCWASRTDASGGAASYGPDRDGAIAMLGSATSAPWNWERRQ